MADRLAKLPFIKLVGSTFFNEAETKQRLADFILSADMLSMGEETRKFEEAFAAKQRRKFSVFVNSGSSANLILLQALMNLGRVSRNATVGFTSLTWATNVMPIIQLGLTPRSIDICADTLNVSPETLSGTIGGLDVLFLTNVLGFADDLPRIRRMCADSGVILLEDNCEGLGSIVSGTLLGNFSLASTFSFYVAHHISTIEGGMVCVDDEELYRALLMTRSHGWDRNLEMAWRRKLQNDHGIDDFFAKYAFYDLAYNVRPTDINAFIGNQQLQYWDTIVAARHRNFLRFTTAIKRNSDLVPIDVAGMEVVSAFAMPVIVRHEDRFAEYRDRFISGKVEIRPIIAGDMTQQPFYKKYVSEGVTRPNASMVQRRGFYFSNAPDLNESEFQFIESLLKP